MEEKKKKRKKLFNIHMYISKKNQIIRKKKEGQIKKKIDHDNICEQKKVKC